MRARSVLAWCLASCLASCTVIADFPADNLIESTEALCGNGEDDDADGLTDCQDWKCLDRAVCCAIPTVVMEDAFESPACAAASCADQDRTCAPDPERWERWGAPYPYLCEGALAIGKDAICYPVGLLSRASVRLEPALRVEARVSGVPEPAGFLRISLTTETVVVDGVDPCADLAPVPTLFGLVYARADEGVRIIATVEEEAVAELVVPAGDGHDVSISVAEDRTVRFAVDGVTFASTEDPLPADLLLDARVIVRGVGMSARLEHLRVTAGTQCDVPGDWTMAAPFAPLAPPPNLAVWDELDQSFPNARVDGARRLVLTYSGCRAAASPICDPFTHGIGEAVAAPGSPLAHPEQPLFATSSFVPINFTMTGVLDFHVEEADRLAYFAVENYRDWIGRCTIDGELAAIEASVEPILTGAPNAWDASMSRPMVLARGQDRLLFYAGHRADEPDRWRIGLAISRDGAPFASLPEPVLDVGAPGSFDERSVEDPTVVFDETRQLYRMWYRATGVFGAQSIGYAVSTDGEVWHRYPGNPVLRSADLGLVTIGSPSVVDDGGGLRMWIHGTAPGAIGRTIYELENRGEPFVALP